MRILGIETSCDETAAAIVEKKSNSDSVAILSNITATSAGLHARTGGVIPEQAARKQIQSIIPVIDLTLKDSGVSPKDIDAIAVTVGPGLIGSLLVGVETAKTLSLLWKKPVIPVNHLVGHIYANWISQSSNRKSQNYNLKLKTNNSKLPAASYQTPTFPAIALVVSGGHTDLVLMTDHPSAGTKRANLRWIGGTRDDAAGEAFDKTARLLGLPYPGGPNLSRVADEYINKHPNGKLNLFPRPLLDEKNYDWSFSGLKTAVLNEVKKIAGKNSPGVRLANYEEIFKKIPDKSVIPELAAEIQEAIVDSLVTKTTRAIYQYRPKSFLLAGGVAANFRLREKLENQIKAEKLQAIFHVPEIALCTDNAAYIAAYACYNYKAIGWKNIEANPELTIMGEA